MDLTIEPYPKRRAKASKRLLETSNTKTRPLSKSAKLKALKEQWSIPTTNNFKLRYTGLRGVYWYWLSRDVRKSEWEKYNGECLTCLERIEKWEEADCGHIVASRWCGEFLRFNRMNLTIQHKKCNNPRFCPQAGVMNAINIDKRHGTGYMDRLVSLRKTEAKEPSQDQYRELIRALPSYQAALLITL